MAVDVAIIDHEIGNLFSVKKACEYFGLKAVITADVAVIMKAAAAILPGVGAFGEAMANLKRLDLISPVKDFIALGRPFMGICLGMQLLMSTSEEFGHHQGLDVIRGSVVRFPDVDRSGAKLKVPQVGWNRIYFPSLAEDNYRHRSLLRNISSGEYMYFVHSFYAQPSDREVILSLTTYGDVDYCSGIISKNIQAFQFHPEKSGERGLEIYREFAAALKCNRSME